MTTSSRLVFVVTISGLLWCGLPSSAAAQINPTMPSQASDKLKENLYAQFTDYRKSLNPEERRLAYPAARDYLRKFGGDNDSNAKEVQKFVTDYERACMMAMSSPLTPPGITLRHLNWGVRI
jgi:hypothetical protein